MAKNRFFLASTKTIITYNSNFFPHICTHIRVQLEVKVQKLFIIQVFGLGGLVSIYMSDLSGAIGGQH